MTSKRKASNPIMRAMFQKYPECFEHNVQMINPTFPPAQQEAYCHECRKRIHVTREEIQAATPPSTYARRLTEHLRDMAENGPPHRRR